MVGRILNWLQAFNKKSICELAMLWTIRAALLFWCTVSVYRRLVCQSLLGGTAWANKFIFFYLYLQKEKSCSFNQTLWIGEFYIVKIVQVVLSHLLCIFKCCRRVVLFTPLPVLFGFKAPVVLTYFVYSSYCGCHFVKSNWRGSTIVSIVSTPQDGLYPVDWNKLQRVYIVCGPCPHL